MRRMLLLIAVILTLSKSFAQTFDAAAVRRIGDYGRLWTVIDLFHPAMAYQGINRDSLFVDNVNGLLQNPSSLNFKAAVQRMLARLNDPRTAVEQATPQADSAVLSQRPLLRWLPNKVALLHFDAEFMSASNGSNAVTPLTKMMDSLKEAKVLLIDLRNEQKPDEISAYYEDQFARRLVAYLIPQSITLPGQRTRIHYGHESQTFDMSQYYFQGWQTMNGGVIESKQKGIRRPLCLIVNRFNRAIMDHVAALQKTGVASVVADGSMAGAEPAPNYKMELADGLTVNVCIGEAVYADGSHHFLPDVQWHKGNMPEDSLINAALRLVKTESRTKSQKQATTQAGLPVNPFVSAYDSLAYPSAPLRLLGLMRYWTAINYFCPNKDRLTKSWDSVLYEYVPKFLAAKDSFAYHRTAASLIKEINDSHGFFASNVFRPLTAMTPPVQLLYVEGKTIVNQVLNDSLKSFLSPGDEVLTVNGTPIKTFRDSLAQYIGASNESSLQREVTIRTLAGKIGSSVTLSLLHNGASTTLTLPRSANFRDVAFAKGKGPVWKKLEPRLGYVDFGRLEAEQIDSLFTEMKATDALIIDDRSYPRGTVWTMINYLTDKTVKGAMGTTVIADSPDPATTTLQNSIWEIPVTPKNRYTGKLIILVNEITQSQAEYSCMVLQAATKNVTIVGSQTAGADGDVTGIVFPGGIRTAFSGHGIHYPDGRPTQGIGIVPDIEVKPTVAGIKAGRDEVLDRAIQFAKTGK